MEKNVHLYVNYGYKQIDKPSVESIAETGWPKSDPRGERGVGFCGGVLLIVHTFLAYDFDF